MSRKETALKIQSKTKNWLEALRQIDFEIEVIQNTGFLDYFLIVWTSFVAKEEKFLLVPEDPGRLSCRPLA